MIPSRSGSDSNDASMAVGAVGLGAGERPGGLRYLLSGDADPSTGALLADWDLFVQNSLHAILDHQMVGSYSAIANLSNISQVSGGAGCRTCCVDKSSLSPLVILCI